eukprot:CAMPEP_0116079226 /NCGR_PEP_ID=MMETSP0327-20121206/1031_1 /TAXON_ID=44447 /ORGANISM="Pseudo-nitzschia delicatissima, Strain B596" /LENGTH=474 /DNA_ID=CAMNT_0003569841 /DNA_START=102 /DNA_END=1526 /DNA_ORIENTATION=+
MVNETKDENSGFSFRRLSIDRAVAPLLSRPVAPFDRTERKKAYTSALFYSECFLHGIEPKVADTAAAHAQGAYDKWWVKSTASISLESTKENGSRNDDSFEKSERSPKRKKQKQPLSESDRTYEKTEAGFTISSPPIALIPGKSRDEEKDEDTYSKCIEFIATSSQNGSLISRSPLPPQNIDIEVVKDLLIEDLRLSGGDVKTPEYLRYQSILERYFIQNKLSKIDLDAMEGNWLTISKPTFTECTGKNEKGEDKFSLGRMSFDMFKPTGLNCSFQASFNLIQEIDPNDPGRPLYIPQKLMQEIQNGDCILRTYDIVNAITIEAGQDRKGNTECQPDGDYIVPRPIRGILTTQGYSIPDPNQPNRISVWFSGGSLEVQDEESDVEEWKKIFDTSSAPNRDIREYANNLAARLLLGANIPDKLEEDGTLRFDLKRPIGGHGSVFCDIVYMDENLRIMHGHHDSVYVCVRVSDSVN